MVEILPGATWRLLPGGGVSTWRAFLPGATWRQPGASLPGLPGGQPKVLFLAAAPYLAGNSYLAYLAGTPTWWTQVFRSTCGGVLASLGWRRQQGFNFLPVLPGLSSLPGLPGAKCLPGLPGAKSLPGLPGVNPTWRWCFYLAGIPTWPTWRLPYLAVASLPGGKTLPGLPGAMFLPGLPGANSLPGLPGVMFLPGPTWRQLPFEPDFNWQGAAWFCLPGTK